MIYSCFIDKFNLVKTIITSFTGWYELRSNTGLLKFCFSLRKAVLQLI